MSLALTTRAGAPRPDRGGWRRRSWLLNDDDAALPRSYPLSPSESVDWRVDFHVGTGSPVSCSVVVLAPAVRPSAGDASRSRTESPSCSRAVGSRPHPPARPWPPTTRTAARPHSGRAPPPRARTWPGPGLDRKGGRLVARGLPGAPRRCLVPLKTQHLGHVRPPRTFNPPEPHTRRDVTVTTPDLALMSVRPKGAGAQTLALVPTRPESVPCANVLETARARAGLAQRVRRTV